MVAFSRSILPQLWLLLLLACTVSISSSIKMMPGQDQTIERVVSDDDDLNPFVVSTSSLASPPPPQPQCWVDALKIFQGDDIEESSKVCEVISHHQKKALAFELARCHLQDLARPIIDSQDDPDIQDPQDCIVSTSSVVTTHEYFDDDDDADRDGGGGGPFFPNLSKCLKFLTDAGANAYTHFLSQVVQLCNRLTQHMAIDFQQHAAAQLAKISQQASAQIDKLLRRQEEREQDLKEQQEDFFKAMHESQAKLWEDSKTRLGDMQTWTTEFVEGWTHRDEEHKEKHEAWLFNQTRILQDRTSVLEKHHAEMQTLSEKVAATSSILQPLVILEALFSHAMRVFAFIQFFFPSFVAFLVTWALARPKWCNRIRKSLFVIMSLEAAARLLVFASLDNTSSSSDSTSSTDKMALMFMLQSCFAFVASSIYTLNVIFSICSCCWRQSDGYGATAYFDDDVDDGDIDDYDEDYLDYEEINQKMAADFKRYVDESIAKVATQYAHPGASATTAPVPPPLHRRSSSEPGKSDSFVVNEIAASPILLSNLGGVPRGVDPLIPSAETQRTSFAQSGVSEVHQTRPNESTTISTVVKENSIASFAKANKSDALKSLPEASNNNDKKRGAEKITGDDDEDEASYHTASEDLMPRKKRKIDGSAVPETVDTSTGVMHSDSEQDDDLEDGSTGSYYD